MKTSMAIILLSLFTAFTRPQMLFAQTSLMQLSLIILFLFIVMVIAIVVLFYRKRKS